MSEQKLQARGDGTDGGSSHSYPLASSATATQAERPPRTGPKRILVVEDEPVTLTALVRFFGQHGCEVLAASTVADGFRLLEEGPDCLVLDMSLPDGLGLEILERIRERKIPVRIAVTTGSVDPLLLGTAASLNPDVLLQKPVDPYRLLGAFGVE